MIFNRGNDCSEDEGSCRNEAETFTLLEGFKEKWILFQILILLTNTSSTFEDSFKEADVFISFLYINDLSWGGGDRTQQKDRECEASSAESQNPEELSLPPPGVFTVNYGKASQSLSAPFKEELMRLLWSRWVAPLQQTCFLYNKDVLL